MNEVSTEELIICRFCRSGFRFDALKAVKIKNILGCDGK